VRTPAHAWCGASGDLTNYCIVSQNGSWYSLKSSWYSWKLGSGGQILVTQDPVVVCQS
jgi:hypothetical protein